MTNTSAVFSVAKLTGQLLPQIANLWHTFGYFTVSEVISKKVQSDLLLLSEDVYRKRRGSAIEELPDTQGAFEGYVWEEFPEISGRLLTSLVSDLIQALLGPRWLYLGSDLSIFAKTSTQPWHRDWNLPLPILKLGYYISKDRIRKGGEFRIIPGSHRINDSYTSQLDRALAWPSTPSQPGGLNERGFFPSNKDYSSAHGMSARSTFSRAKQYILGRALVDKNANSCELPHTAVSVRDPSQLLFFDPRAIHAGTLATPPQRRVMLSALFCPNPFDPDFEPRLHGLDVTREVMAESLLETLVLDRMVHNMDTTYHPTGLCPDIPSQHLVELDFSPGAYAISFGHHQRVVSKIDGLDRSPGADPSERAWNYMRRKLSPQVNISPD